MEKSVTINITDSLGKSEKNREPFPSAEDLPDPRLKPSSPALAGGFFTTSHLGSKDTHRTMEKTRESRNNPHTTNI